MDLLILLQRRDLKLVNKIKSFTNKEKCWDSFYYYEIFNNNGQKSLRVDYHIRRVDRGLDYLSWSILEYECDIITIENFLEWDRFYQLDNMIKSFDEYLYNEPYECFRKANELMTLNDVDGRIRLDIIDINEDTPCGSYFGW